TFAAHPHVPTKARAPLFDTTRGNPSKLSARGTTAASTPIDDRVQCIAPALLRSHAVEPRSARHADARTADDAAIPQTSPVVDRAPSGRTDQRRNCTADVSAPRRGDDRRALS